MNFNIVLDFVFIITKFYTLKNCNILFCIIYKNCYIWQLSYLYQSKKKSYYLYIIYIIKLYT